MFLSLQLYFYQRILQLRAAQEQEAQKWITCLQSIQQLHTSPSNAASIEPSHTAAAATEAMPSPSPSSSPLHRRKSASAAGDGVIMVTARSGADTGKGHSADSRGVLPPHLLVEERHVSYSPLSEHALTSPFLSDAHRQWLLDRASVSQPVPTAEAATSTEEEAQPDVKAARRLNFAE